MALPMNMNEIVSATRADAEGVVAHDRDPRPNRSPPPSSIAPLPDGTKTLAPSKASTQAVRQAILSSAVVSLAQVPHILVGTSPLHEGLRSIDSEPSSYSTR